LAISKTPRRRRSRSFRKRLLAKRPRHRKRADQSLLRASLAHLLQWPSGDLVTRRVFQDEHGSLLLASGSQAAKNALMQIAFRFFYLFTSFLCLAGSLALGASGQKSSSLPNIVIIFTDDQGY